MPVVAFALLSAAPVCPVPDCGMYDFLSLNLAHALLLLLACLHGGFAAQEASAAARRLLGGAPASTLRRRPPLLDVLAVLHGVAARTCGATRC